MLNFSLSLQHQTQNTSIMNRKELKEYLIKQGAINTYQADNMTDKELFDSYLNWHGLINWTDKIIDAYRAAFGINDKHNVLKEEIEDYCKRTEIWDEADIQFAIEIAEYITSKREKK